MVPVVNTSAMQVFLDQVAATRPPEVNIVVVLDGITLVILPPYSPELIPTCADHHPWAHSRMPMA